MSDWEIAPNEGQQQPAQPQSDWEMVDAPVSETLGQSLKAAPGRIWQDFSTGINQAYDAIPGYLQKAKTEVPAASKILLNAFLRGSNLPSSMPDDQFRHASQQVAAGFAEQGKNFFNAPHDFANYLSQTLHLLPADLNQKIQMARMPDDETQQAINSTFGQPTQPGEAFLRGLGRHSLDIAGTSSLAKVLNPLQLTDKGVAKSVVKELNNQVDKHTARYNSLWNQADKKGFTNVPFDRNTLDLASGVLDKYYPEKSGISVKAFLEDPSLMNAQSAQSDLGILKRALEEKARTAPLLESEKAIHKIFSDTEKHIEGNMFTDAKGNKNENLANKYKDITNSYRQNVVPYRYNPDIQSYLNKELTAKELVQRLNKGEFAAKKGSAHPAFGIRNALLPLLGGVGGLGALGGAKYLYDQATGNSANSQRDHD